MTLQTKLIIYIGLFMVLVGYYNYTNYIMGTQKHTIERLKVKVHVDTQNTKTKVSQATLDNIKENYEADKNDSIINEHVGIHRMQF